LNISPDAKKRLIESLGAVGEKCIAEDEARAEVQDAPLKLKMSDDPKP